ncbi:hypothetical protein IM40_03745 [Candidatus Paracaedimonas acanthamoebae]|nr:hypothetical protein IM40_03745 [Candidatus Paracaedimonas acanthamoebae]
MIKKLLIISSIVTLGCVPILKAGVINVRNENNKELLIKIEAVGDSSAGLKQTIPAEYISSFTINSDQLNGKTNFIIKIIQLLSQQI